MKIFITGGTGFIGSAVIHQLSQASHDLVLLTRGPSRIELYGSRTIKYIHWEANAEGIWDREVNGCDMVINMVGKNVFEERWNDAVKKEILRSRSATTSLLVEAIGRAERKPKLLISVSAVGYYGDRQDETITEASTGGNDFLADVVRQWEGAAYSAEQYGVRVSTPRIGLVLGRSGGMIGSMTLPFKLFVGGPIGTGKQYLPWVHMQDVVRGILYPIENEQFRGIYNLVSPNPVTMKDFAHVFGSVLQRPSWLPVPDLALNLLYGEGAKVILSGQKAVPERLTAAGFKFQYTDLRAALENLLWPPVR
jgi:uncharacterized protein (TIGR01777 family)